jgi:hypothetical protein
MFKFTRGTLPRSIPTVKTNPAKVNAERVFSARAASPVVLEGLEDRRLMSVSPASVLGIRLGGFGGHGEFARAGHGVRGGTVDFSQAPDAVQSGLNTLASDQNLTAPTDTTPVYLGNSNGVETYSVLLSGTGTTTRLTVDAAGHPVTAPTKSTTTFGALNNSAVTERINTIAAALGLTAPVDATVVNVSTPASGPAVYSVTLSDANTDTIGTNTFRRRHATTITVDANGNPVGDQRLPLSTLPTAVQNGLASNAPSGATALLPTSIVAVRTLDGVTTYSATYSGTGTTTTVTVNTSGALASLPGASQVTFSTIPVAAQNELQTLASADGVTGTIAGTQTVTAFNEANGTTVYTVRLVATETNTDGTTETHPITLSVDQAGNVTVPPTGGPGGGLFGGGVFGAHGFGPGDFNFDFRRGRGGRRGGR